MDASTSGASRRGPAAFAIKHHHGAVSVPDLAAAIDWYARVFGFAIETRVSLPHVPADVVTLRRDDLRIELFQVQGAVPAHADRRVPDLDLRTLGNKHFAFAVQDLAGVVRELERMQVDIVLFKQLDFASFAFLRDPAGNLVELTQQPDLWAVPQP